MKLTINKQTCIVFDLDDTLYKEVEYLKSGYKHLSSLLYKYTGVEIYEHMYELYLSGANTFDIIKEKYKIPLEKSEFLHEYRSHNPTIKLNEGSIVLLNYVKNKAGKVCVLTDGRSVTQRNKIKSLGIEEYFDDIKISEETGFEKPSIESYLYFQKKYECITNFIYIADNINKDFITPNKLGWITIGLRKSNDSVHPQDLSLNKIYHPCIWVDSLEQILTLT